MLLGTPVCLVEHSLGRLCHYDAAATVGLQNMVLGVIHPQLTNGLGHVVLLS